MSTIYIETSIVSYLREQPSSLVVTAARQLLTHQWWNEQRSKYELVSSQFVLDEAAAGDPDLAKQRLKLLEGIPLVPLVPEIGEIANAIIQRAVLPQKAIVDALHIAATAHHKIDYLLTWNCRHIANARVMHRLHGVFEDLGLLMPVICTPEEMIGDDFPN